MTDYECRKLLDQLKKNPRMVMTNGQKNELLAYSMRLIAEKRPGIWKSPEQLEAEHRARIRKLKCCRECNSFDVEFRSVPAGGVNGSTPGKYYSVVCKNCGHSIGRIFSIENEDGEEAALRKWNNHS